MRSALKDIAVLILRQAQDEEIKASDVASFEPSFLGEP